MISESPTQAKTRERLRLSACGIHPYRVVIAAGMPICYVTEDDQARMLKMWETDNENKDNGNFSRTEPDGLFISVSLNELGIPVYTVSEGETGEHYMEDYYSEDVAIRWLLGQYSGLEELAEADRNMLKRSSPYWYDAIKSETV